MLAAEDIFENKVTKDAVVWVSFYEIYCRQLFDLLNNRNKSAILFLMHYEQVYTIHWESYLDGNHRLTVMEKHNKQVCITGLMETPTKDVAGLIKVASKHIRLHFHYCVYIHYCVFIGLFDN